MCCVAFEVYFGEYSRETATAGTVQPWQPRRIVVNEYVQKASGMSNGLRRKMRERVTCAILLPYNEEPVLFERRLATPFVSVLWVLGISILDL